MILTTLFSDDNQKMWRVDVKSDGSVIRVQKFTGVLNTPTNNPYSEAYPDDLLGRPLNPISGDLRKSKYVVVGMKNGNYRIFPISEGDEKILYEYRDFFLENKIENYKNTMEFLKI